MDFRLIIVAVGAAIMLHYLWNENSSLRDTAENLKRELAGIKTLITATAQPQQPVALQAQQPTPGQSVQQPRVDPVGAGAQQSTGTAQQSHSTPHPERDPQRNSTIGAPVQATNHQQETGFDDDVQRRLSNINAMFQRLSNVQQPMEPEQNHEQIDNQQHIYTHHQRINDQRHHEQRSNRKRAERKLDTAEDPSFDALPGAVWASPEIIAGSQVRGSAHPLDQHQSGSLHIQQHNTAHMAQMPAPSQRNYADDVTVASMMPHDAYRAQQVQQPLVLPETSDTIRSWNDRESAAMTIKTWAMPQAPQRQPLMMQSQEVLPGRAPGSFNMDDSMHRGHTIEESILGMSQSTRHSGGSGRSASRSHHHRSETVNLDIRQTASGRHRASELRIRTPPMLDSPGDKHSGSSKKCHGAMIREIDGAMNELSRLVKRPVTIDVDSVGSGRSSRHSKSTANRSSPNRN